MSNESVTNDQLAELIENVRESTPAFIRGDIRHYLTLIKHADDYTLFAPFGGPARHGFDTSEEYIESMERYFQSGAGHLELIESHTSGNLAVLIAIERQHGVVGHLPDQDWSLRITLVFRREDSEWHLVHRHADPLVHPITLDQIGALARG